MYSGKLQLTYTCRLIWYRHEGDVQGRFQVKGRERSLLEGDSLELRWEGEDRAFGSGNGLSCTSFR